MAAWCVVNHRRWQRNWMILPSSRRSGRAALTLSPSDARSSQTMMIFDGNMVIWRRWRTQVLVPMATMVRTNAPTDRRFVATRITREESARRSTV
ncbi:unnamed protein product [Nesidiocoris tenuis]|uniref:Uncharacterized protein n=1 Tax=Nesidiocoris tenuis TaxID=355587 RepID=A0A6H5H6V2_9HEMI|nr:unnamed protein product [Nesidiocoris tenuis]